MRHPLILLVALGALSFTACEMPEQTDMPQAADPSLNDHRVVEDTPHELAVEVPADGKKFDPQVEPKNLPEGVRYCPHGEESHYARMTEGDGTCPVCGHELARK